MAERQRPRFLRLAAGAAVAAAMAGIANSLRVGQQLTFQEIHEATHRQPSQTQKRRMQGVWQRSGRKGEPARRRKHKRVRAPRAWRRERVRKLRARRR